MVHDLVIRAARIFADRVDAGAVLAEALESESGDALVVVGLARGGVEVAAEVARRLRAPLDVVAVRKVGHPLQPEYAIGAVTPGGGVYIRSSDGLSEAQVAAAVADATGAAERLDERLHADHGSLPLEGRTVLVVDDGLATGATMIAALRWARARGAAHTVAAVPVAATRSLDLLRGEANAVVCPYAISHFFAVGDWYASFDQVDDARVISLLGENRAPAD